jgi:fructose-1,6-bisphosphatase I
MVISRRMNKLGLALIAILSLMAVAPSTCFRALSPQQRQRFSVDHSSSKSRLYQAPFSVGPLVSGEPLRKKKLKTFVRYLEVECWKRAELRSLEPTLQAIADACKQINRIVQRAQTDDLYGVAEDSDGNPLEETNVQGEVQQKLDVVCNTIFMRAFCGSSSSIHSIASEEEDEPRCCADVMVSLDMSRDGRRG